MFERSTDVDSNVAAALAQDSLQIAEAQRRLRVLSDIDADYAAALNDDYIYEVQRDGMKEYWRESIVGWFQSFGEHMGQAPSTVASATNFLDRYMSRTSCTAQAFQLAAVGCLFLASKVGEARPLGVADCVSLSDGVLTVDKDDVCIAELKVLTTLRWRLNPPGAAPVVDACVALWARPGPAADAVAAMAHGFARRARRDYACLGFSDALVGITATLGALREHDVPAADARAWMDRVEEARLPYVVAPNAAAMVDACARRICALCAPHRLLPDPGQYRGPAPSTPPGSPLRVRSVSVLSELDFSESDDDDISRELSELSDMDQDSDVEAPGPDRASPTDATADIYAEPPSGLPDPPKF